jgi:hypothetical protein
MPNGVAHALVTLTPDPPAPIKTAQPRAANGTAIVLPSPIAVPDAVPGEVERSIGEAMADAVIMIGAEVMDWENGGLRPFDPALAGERFAKVCMMQLAHDGSNFAAIARSAGRRELWRRNDAGFRTHYGASFNEAAIDRAFDELLDHVLAITTQVVDNERARAH